MKSVLLFLVFLPNAFGIFSNYFQLLFRWKDGTVSAFPPKTGCFFYQGCYPEYQRLPNGWPFFDKPIAPNIVFKEPAFRPWTKIDAILFPVVPKEDVPATPPPMMARPSTTEALPEIPVRSLIPEDLVTKPDEENTIKGVNKASPTSPPPIFRVTQPSVQQASTAKPKFTPPPPIFRNPKPSPTANPSINTVVEEASSKKYTTPPSIQRTARPNLDLMPEGQFVGFSTTTTRTWRQNESPQIAGGKPNLISWEQNRFPMPRTTRRPTPRRRTTRVPSTAVTEPTNPVYTKVPKDGAQVFIERWTKTHERTSPKPIYDRSR